jgi:ATP-dependent Clp protease ATP-binding subunit ClpC
VSKQAAQQRRGMGKFERFTGRARRVVVIAQERARALKHHYIGTEHVLLGLVDEEEGLAAKVITMLGGSRDAVIQAVNAAVTAGSDEPSGHIPFTPQAKKVLDESLVVALDLGHNYIGTEHILLGLLRVPDGLAAQVLSGLGIEYEQARATVEAALMGHQHRGGKRS